MELAFVAFVNECCSAGCHFGLAAKYQHNNDDDEKKAQRAAANQNDIAKNRRKQEMHDRPFILNELVRDEAVFQPWGCILL